LKETFALRTLTEVFAPGSPSLPEGLRTLVVSPARFVEPGATVRAVLSFRNLGGGTAKGIRVRFALPEGLTYLVDSARVDNADLDSTAGVGALVASSGAEIGDVEAGAERRISVAYIVAPTMENGTTIELQAAIASIDLPLTGSNIVRLVVRSKPLLQGEETKLSIASPREVLPGSELTVSARVRNAGQSSANDVVVALPVPIGTSFVAGSAQIDGSAVDDRRERDPIGHRSPLVIARKLGPGATATLTYRVKVDAPLQDGTKIEARGWVASRETSEFELTPANVSVASRASFDGEQTALEVTQAGGAALAEDVAPGAAVLIKLRALNAGTSTAKDVALAITLPPGLEAAVAGARRDGQPVSPARDGESFVLPVGALDAGLAVSFELPAFVNAPSPHGRSLPIAARVRSGGSSRSFERLLTVASSPRFGPVRNRIVRESPPIVAPGDRVAFTIAVVNDGTAVANDVIVHVAVDDGVEDLSVAENGETLRLHGDEIALGAVEPHAPRLLRVEGRVAMPLADGSRIGCRARVEGLELAEEFVLVRSRARFTPASSSVRRTSEEAIRPDRSVAVAISVKNEGDDVARDLHVALRSSPELRLESVTGATRDGSTLILGEVGAGATREATVSYRLLPFVPRGTLLTVDGVLAGPTILPVSLETLSFSSHAEPRLTDGAALVTTPRDAIDSGAEVGFTLVLRNAGDGAAERVVIRGEAPPQTAYVPSSTSVNGVPLLDQGGRSLLWSEAGLVLSDVAPGAEIIVRWLSIVNTPLPPETVIVARLDVACDDAGSFSVESAPLAVRSAPAFAVPSVALPFSIAGAAASNAVLSADSSMFELPMRRVTPLPPAAAAQVEVPAQNGASEHADAVDQDRIEFALDLSGERARGVIEYLEMSNFRGLIEHLFVLRGLFPEAVFADGASELLENENAQLREIFNKLFVKLRLPRFTIGPRDIEPDGSRAAAQALFAGLAHARAAAVVPGTEGLRVRGSLSRAECAALGERLRSPQHGEASTWSALAHLLGTRIERDGEAFDSLERYRSELIATLDGFAKRPQATFLAALGGERSAELDALLGGVIEDLRPQVESAP
jgi:uncharacterized repeat protein (TIGR01451 family)